jgi:hypothetical protein
MTTRRTLAALVAVLGMAYLTGCQQRMAEQPAPRPFEQHSMFPHKQSARPLEPGVVHRNQGVEGDPLVTWLTAEGRKGANGKASGDASFDKASVVPPVGAPTKVENFVSEFPFEVTENDLRRGQTMYNAICAECHGGAGFANGKIPERGFLRPPSYHTDPAGKEKDWSTLSPQTGKPLYSALDAGYSRGFYRWGQKVALKDAPVGYFYQVITLGYGAMGSHDVQLRLPEDRWRVIAYIRALQFSQAVADADLSPDAKAKLNQTKSGEAHK